MARLARSLVALCALSLAGLDVGACSGGSRPPGLASNFGGGSSTTTDGGGFLFGQSGQGGGAYLPDGSTCAAEVRKAELLPLDMYVLLDKSASMNETTSTGVTKWGAISAALESFVQAPSSAGLGVGIQYFPLMKPGVPATCTTHAQCGAGGPCLLSACDNQTTVDPCVTDADCGSGHCVGLGECAQQPVAGPFQYCSPIGAACPAPYGTCIDIPNRTCTHAIDCTVSRYATPAVPIGTLPGGAAALVQSIESTSPAGDTPTGPALEGAVTNARAWASSHPGHTVVAVLATDGLPTECTPLDIGPVSALAAAGLKGTPPVPTFVIGVFGPADTQSPANLQAIAQSGGTAHAFIVDTSGDVTAEFTKALDAIRTSSLISCDLDVPKAGSSGALDFDRVNVSWSDKDGHATELVDVTTSAGCAKNPGIGWYYDVDPATGATPTKITLCSDVCGSFRGSLGASISLQVGCKTIIR